MKRLLCIAVLLMPLLLGAAPADFWFRHLSVEHGLASNSVRAILQDRYGFLWVGTDNGLCRYDGTGFRRFALSPRGTNDYISSLYDTGDNLYVGTDEGVYVFDYGQERFARLHVATENDSIHSNVNHIARDNDGNFWFTTVGQGLFRYNPDWNYTDHYPFDEAGGMMACTLIDHENYVWTVTNWSDPALYKLNKAENRFEPFKLAYDGKPYDNSSLVVIEDAEHNLWLGTWECGLHKVDRYTGKVSVYLPPAEGKGTMHIHSMTEYGPHELLIGSDDGLLLFHTQTGKHRLFTEDETNPGAISNRFVYPIARDREGGIWVGTYYSGINYLPPYTGQFERFMHLHGEGHGRVVSHFCEDSGGNIWIASDDGGLSCFNPRENRFYPLPAKLDHFTNHNLHALCMDGDDLWIGTYTDGVSVLNTRSWNYRTYTANGNDTTTLDGTSSYAIFRDSKQRIWVATMSGINLYDRKRDCFSRIRDLGTLTIDIDEDSDGFLWFSTVGRGLFRYKPETGSWKQFVQSPDALGNNEVNCFHIDSNGTKWIGTTDGLCRYNPESGHFEQVPLSLPSNTICGIVEEQHVLWLTTSRGLVRYEPATHTATTTAAQCQVFTASDGLLSEQFLPNAALKASDGKIYVGSVNGFNAFYPYRIRTNAVAPPVVITAVELFSRPLPIGDKRLKESPTSASAIELWPADAMFSLRFASLSYCSPEKNRYAYRLEGFDKDWNYVGSQNKATYTNLPAGRYLFRVKATNNDGLWSHEEARLAILIHPPFYQTIAFKLLLALLLGVSLFFFIRALLRRAAKQHAEEINRLNQKKEKEMHEAKINFFTTIAHEIRTPVSLIIAPLEQTMKSPAQIPAALRKNLEMIDRNSQRLLFLVNQLLDFRKVEQEGLTIRFAPHHIRQLMHAVAERFTPYIEQSGARLEVTYPEADFTATVDGEALTKLLSNLLSNAAKYTTDRVHLACHTDRAAATFTLTVTDNGAGISPEEQQKIFRPFYQAAEGKPGTGIGLSIVQSIVSAHHGTIRIDSAAGRGTSFVVTLPVRQDESPTPTQEANPPAALPEDILPEAAAPTEEAHDRPTMLIVEDNEEMQQFLADSFADRYHILTAADGLQALERLRSCDVSLVVSDWMMPRMDGIHLCQTLRADQNFSHIPFILLTARTDTHSKIEGADCGADAYIEKPFSLRYLEATIKNLLDMRRLLREKFSRMPMVPIGSIAANPTDSRFLSRINEVIEQNFSNPQLTVDFLAEELCISRSGLFAKIRTLADATPNELIQIVRLKRAAALIRENRYRINEICYMVGFNNPSYFSKCFLKQFGIKPKDFLASQS